MKLKDEELACVFCKEVNSAFKYKEQWVCEKCESNLINNYFQKSLAIRRTQEIADKVCKLIDDAVLRGGFQ